jgi:hypothetical protein
VVLATDVVEQLHDVGSGLRVEVTRRLVGQDDIRSVEQGARNDDALLFTTREGVGHAVALILHPHLGQHLRDAFIDLFLRAPAGGSEHEAKVLLDGAVSQQLKVLEDDAQPATQVGHATALHVTEVKVQDVGLAVRDGQLGVDGL